MDAWLARKHALFGRLITKNAVAAARARKSTLMNLGSGKNINFSDAEQLNLHRMSSRSIENHTVLT